VPHACRFWTVLVVAAVGPANPAKQSAGDLAAFVWVGVATDMALAAGLLHHVLVFVSAAAMALVGPDLPRT